MAVHILQTKIQIPPLPTQIILRARLFEMLDKSLEPFMRLTLISAPAGYGKTSLVNAWLRDRGLRAAWISLDEQDNDPIRFANYLVHALRLLDSKYHRQEPQADISAGADFQESVLVPLLNRLGESAGSTVIVLDDFHCIQDASIHQFIEFLIEYLPAEMHLVILTRADPALPIARLRARGQINELRMQDLRFRKDEAAAFLRLFEYLKLSGEDLDTILRRTEGWIAGLQMAVASLRGQIDQSGFIQGFSGGHRYIMDFLLDEVLRRQEPRLQRFLLETSILPRLSAELCNAVLAESDGDSASAKSVLRELEHANLFVVPLDEQRSWYRYHRLFAELLQSRLQEADIERYRHLNLRASEWFEVNGQMEDAIRHALNGNESHRAADLVERAAQAWMMRSETATLNYWIQRLPETELADRPRLAIFQAWTLLFQGAPMSVVQSLLPKPEETGERDGGAALLHSFVALSQGKMEQGLQLAEYALQVLPEDEIYLRDFAVFTLAGTHIAMGDNKTGERMLEERSQLSLSTGNRSAAVIFLTEMAEIRMKEMRLDESHSLYKRALQAARDSSGNMLPIGGRALIGLGNIALERYELERAERLLDEGIERAERWNLISTLEAQLSVALLHFARRDWDKFERTFQRLYELADRFDATQIDDQVVALVESGFNARLGNFQPVRGWVADRNLDQAPGHLPSQYSDDYLTGRFYKYELPVLIRLFIADSRYDEAHEALDQLLSSAMQAKRPFLQLEGLILDALLLCKEGQMAESHAALCRALELALPANVLRLFLTESEELLELLRDTRPRLESPDLIAFVDSILEAAGRAPSGQVMSGGPDSLSPREHDVLQLLPSELTAEELADALVISVNTVRTHMKNIYAKLGVHSRHQAVETARKMGLI